MIICFVLNAAMKILSHNQLNQQNCFPAPPNNVTGHASACKSVEPLCSCLVEAPTLGGSGWIMWGKDVQITVAMSKAGACAVVV